MPPPTIQTASPSFPALKQEPTPMPKQTPILVTNQKPQVMPAFTTEGIPSVDIVTYKPNNMGGCTIEGNGARFNEKSARSIFMKNAIVEGIYRWDVNFTPPTDSKAQIRIGVAFTSVLGKYNCAPLGIYPGSCAFVFTKDKFHFSDPFLRSAKNEKHMDKYRDEGFLFLSTDFAGGSLISVEADFSLTTLSFFVDNEKVPLVFRPIQGPLHFGITGETVGLSFASVSFSRLSSPTQSSVKCTFVDSEMEAPATATKSLQATATNQPITVMAAPDAQIPSAAVLAYPAATDRYVGEVSKGVPHGQGVCVFSDGSKYEGEWVMGIKVGKGVLTWPTGARYEGEFNNGREGTGVMRGTDAMYVFDGEWKGDKMNGKGVMTSSDGKVYKGEWVNDAYVWKSREDWLAHLKVGAVNTGLQHIALIGVDGVLWAEYSSGLHPTQPKSIVKFPSLGGFMYVAETRYVVRTVDENSVSAQNTFPGHEQGGIYIHKTYKAVLLTVYEENEAKTIELTVAAAQYFKGIGF